MRTAVHGMPRIGEGRTLKWALEGFWAGRLDADDLEAEAAAIRRQNWEMVAAAGVDFVPSNDFSLYDHVLDAAVAVGAVPKRFRPDDRPVDLASLLRHGPRWGPRKRPGGAARAHQVVRHQLSPAGPRDRPDTAFRANAAKACAELDEAARFGIRTTPVLLGPLTLLLRSAPTQPGFDVMDRLDSLVDAYVELLAELHRHGATWVRLDEPALVEDRTRHELAASAPCLPTGLGRLSARPSIAVSTYFGHVGDGDGGPAEPAGRGGGSRLLPRQREPRAAPSMSAAFGDKVALRRRGRRAQRLGERPRRLALAAREAR